MKLELRDYPKPFEDERGVTRMDGRDLAVVDSATGEKLEDLVGFLWCSGELLTHPLEGESEGLLTPEHVEKDSDYLVLVVPCPSAKTYDNREWRP